MTKDAILPTDEVRIREQLRPGDWGAIISLHGSVYCTEFGFAPAFEAYVARTVADFILADGGDGKVWLAEAGQRLVGCAAVVRHCRRSAEFGQVRWVLLHSSVRGRGLGADLMGRVLSYCRSRGFAKVCLETTNGLPASLALYRKVGFEIVEDEPAKLWGEQRRLIRMELELAAD